MIKKPSIPSISSLPAELARVIGPMKENIEIITGVREAQLVKLKSDASTTDIVAAINAIITRINASNT